MGRDASPHSPVPNVVVATGADPACTPLAYVAPACGGAWPSNETKSPVPSETVRPARSAATSGSSASAHGLRSAGTSGICSSPAVTATLISGCAAASSTLVFDAQPQTIAASAKHRPCPEALRA
ncbi:MAG: hypothetical protein WCJ30_12335 [Deltaproteobacteria bacterium]